MPPIDQRDSQRPDLQARACLDRTRSAVLNVLVAVGFAIAISGWLLRSRPAEKQPRGSPAAYQRLMLALTTIAVASYVSRRFLAGRARHVSSGRRESWFFWSHVLPAGIAAAAAPLGLVCGWFVDPRLGAVSPFWVVSLALGFLALPRGHELEALHPNQPPAGAPQA